MDDAIIWSPGVSLDAVEKMVILKAFRHYRGNKTHTANALGIAIRTLDTKLASYEVNAKDERERAENEKRDKQKWLDRSRGINTPNNIYTEKDAKEDAQATLRAATGFHEKPVATTPTQPSMPVSKRAEIQNVLPRHATANSESPKRRSIYRTDEKA